MKHERANGIANDIISLYKKYGSNEYVGEKITQLQHMVQTAALAKKDSDDTEIVLAAFLHDIGHICAASYMENTMGGFGLINHEKIGAQYLRNRGFSNRIIRLVENHVSAKRYLTYKFTEYYEALSIASKKTLYYQGGKMNAEEAEIFETDDLFNDFIKMRRWDEQAKEENKPLQLSLDYFEQLIYEHLIAQKTVLTIA
jgi:2-amino-1-hydroxyethylphosphonate dioxygenase (glycine-forming)